MDRSQEDPVSQESSDEEEPLPQASTEEAQVPPESTLFDYGRQWIEERPLFSPQSDWCNFPHPDMAVTDFFGLQTHASNVPAMLSSGKPNFLDLTDISFGGSPDEPHRAKRIKTTEVGETHDGFVATDAVLAPLDDTIKLPSAPNLTEEVNQSSSSFLNSATSPEDTYPRLAPDPDKMKSGIDSSAQQTIADGTIADEVVAEIEPNRLSSDGGKKHVVDPFTIKKKPTRSDVGGCLDLNKDLVKEHILCFLEDDQQALVDSGVGVMIEVHDLESTVECKMEIQKLDGNYELRKGWKHWTAVLNLKEGDTIGLYWDKNASHFCFSVVNRLK